MLLGIVFYRSQKLFYLKYTNAIKNVWIETNKQKPQKSDSSYKSLYLVLNIEKKVLSVLNDLSMLQ